MKRTFIYTILLLLIAHFGFNQPIDQQGIDQGVSGGFHFDLMNELIGLAVGGAGGFFAGKNMAKKDS